jgi:hypothetical protein
MECPICYETITIEQYQHLECSHIICKTCTSKLQQCLCPLCRAPIDPLLCGQNHSSTIDLEFQQYLINFENISPSTRILSRRRRNNRIPNLHSLIEIMEIIEMVTDNTNSDTEDETNTQETPITRHVQPRRARNR